MPRRLFRLLPQSVRARLYRIVADQVEYYEMKNAEAIEASLPHVELSARHIRNLQILTDRDALLSVLPHHSIVAEAGVAQGDFSERILSVANPRILHLIDSWSDVRYRDLKASVERRFENEIRRGQVAIHEGLSTSELNKFEPGYFDWVYIDTSHDYKTTKLELEICRDKVKRNGIIAGHDYVKGSWAKRLRYGVIEAVHEFCIKYDWEMIYLTHESDRHLTFGIRQLPGQAV
jgi:Methyltransferase domain